MHDLCVVGLGYIGLPTAVVFASAGLDVLGVDVNPAAVEAIEQGVPHISEPGLAEALGSAVSAGVLQAATAPAAAEAFIIAVPTPFSAGREPDLSYVLAACDAIAPVLHEGALVILESTSPIGATEQVAARLAANRPDLSFPVRGAEPDDSAVAVAYCPERVLPGQILREMHENDRILGGLSEQCTQRALSLYQRVVVGACLGSDARTAELVKLSENSFRDVNIAFANELSMIAAEHDIDVDSVIALSNRHPRVNILRPGPGVGGHCIAVDPWFIVSSSPDTANLIRTAREVNLAKTDWVVAEIERLVPAGATIACLGLSYKPDIDDLRESPAVDVANRLVHLGFDVLVVEPNVTDAAGFVPGAQARPLEVALEQADAAALLVAHREFVAATPQIAECAILIDTVGLLSSAG